MFTVHRSLIASLMLPAMALLSVPVAGEAQQVPRVESFDVLTGPPMENFNMLEGVWDVESHSLLDRLATDRQWVENRMETTYRVLLDGLVVVNDTYGTFNGGDMHGIMIRTYDPDLDEWRFQWMSAGYPHLTEQVRGSFADGVGVFYGSEMNGGRMFRMRFRWKLISEDHAFWEQSYLNPETREWEPNWTLDLRRKG